MKTSHFQNHIKSHSFLLLAHYATFAYQDLLFEYLNKNKAEVVTKINLPLPELPNLKRIEITECENGTVTKTKNVWSMYKPLIVAYLFQTIQLFFLVLFGNKKYDVVIAEDSSLAFVGICLRMMGKCRTIIFYSHGIDLQRFSNPLLNNMYQRLDKFSARNSDIDWALSKIMIDIRRKQGISDDRLVWMPASVPVSSVKRLPKPKYDNRIVFLGVVNEKNGAHIMVNIMKYVLKKVPAARLDIIGNGDLDEQVKKEIAQKGLQKNIELLGVKTFEEFCNLLTDYAVGIAPYLDRLDTLTARSDSMKMRVYLAAGLPVVITEGFHFSDEIDKYKLGFAVPFNPKSFAEKIIILLSDTKLNNAIRNRALKYSEEYDIYKIYDRTFTKILNDYK